MASPASHAPSGPFRDMESTSVRGARGGPRNTLGGGPILALVAVLSLLVGVAAGTGMEAWWEARSEASLEVQYLGVIDADLGEGIQSLDETIAAAETNLRGAEDLRAWLELEHEIPSSVMMKSLRAMATWPRPVVPSRGYTDLAEGGRMTVLRDAAIRRELTSLYAEIDRVRAEPPHAHWAMLGELDALNQGAWIYVFRPEEEHPVQFLPSLRSLYDAGFARYVRGEIRELEEHLSDLRRVKARAEEMRQSVLNRRRELGSL